MSFFSNIKQIQNRSVFIRTQPCNRNLGESKLILAALQKFGEVVSFRNNRLNPSRPDDFGVSGAPNVNTISVTFDSPQAARAAINASTLLIDLQDLDKSNARNHANTDAGANAAAEANADTIPLQNLKPRPGTSTRYPRTVMRCSITECTTDHLSAAKRNPFFGTFNPYERSPVYKGLADMVDKGLEGLADCSTARKATQPLDLLKSVYASASTMGGGSLLELWKQGEVLQRKRETKEKIAELKKRKEELRKDMEMQGSREEKREEIAELERQIEEMEEWVETQKQTEIRQFLIRRRSREMRIREKNKVRQEKRREQQENGQEMSRQMNG